MTKKAEKMQLKETHNRSGLSFRAVMAGMPPSAGPSAADSGRTGTNVLV